MAQQPGLNVTVRGAPSQPPPANLREYVERMARQYNVPSDLAFDIIDKESSGVHQPAGQDVRTSSAGAQGFFQLLPSTAYGEFQLDARDPVQNIEAGVRYLRQALDRQSGDVRRAAMYYHGGPNEQLWGPLTQAYGDDIVSRVRARMTAQAQPPGTVSAVPSTVGTEPPKPGFLGGLKESLGLPSWEDATMAARSFQAHPLESLRETALGVIPAAQGMFALQQEQWDKAGEAGRRADAAPFGSWDRLKGSLEGGLRLGAALAPGVGPFAAETVEQAVGGEAPRAAGRVVGTGAQYLTGAALRRFGPPPKLDIPLTRGERTGSPLWTYSEAIAEKTIPGAGQFQRFRKAQQEALVAKADEVVERIAGGPEKTPYLSGQEAQAAIDVAKDQLKVDVNQRYTAIEQATAGQTQRVPQVTQVPSAAGLVDASGNPVTVPQRSMQVRTVGGLQPETRGLRQFAIPLLRRVREEAKLLPPDALADTIAILEKIAGSPRTLPYQIFQDARSDLLRIARRHGDPIPGKSGGVAKKLAGLTDEAMERAAQQSGLTLKDPTTGKPVALQDYVRETNRQWVEIENTFNESIITKMIAAAPERIPGLMPAMSLDDIATLRRVVPQPQLQQLKAQLVRDWFNKDITGEALIPGVQGLPGRTQTQVRGKVFQANVERFGEARLAELFGPTEAREMMRIAEIAKQIQAKGGSMTASLVAGGVNSAIISGFPASLLAALAGGPGLAAAGVTGGSIGAINLFARLATHPQAFARTRRFLDAVGTGRPELINAAAVALNQALEEAEQQQRAVQFPVLPPRPAPVTPGGRGAGPGPGGPPLPPGRAGGPPPAPPR